MKNSKIDLVNLHTIRWLLVHIRRHISKLNYLHHSERVGSILYTTRVIIGKHILEIQNNNNVYDTKSIHDNRAQ